MTDNELQNAPASFTVIDAIGKDKGTYKYKIQVYIEDCVGCGDCVVECPSNALEMRPIEEERAAGENENLKFFESLPEDVLGNNKEYSV